MARETKFGLLFVLVLTSAFGLLVYKRLHQPLPLMAEAEAELGSEDAGDGPAASTTEAAPLLMAQNDPAATPGKEQDPFGEASFAPGAMKNTTDVIPHRPTSPGNHPTRTAVAAASDPFDAIPVAKTAPAPTQPTLPTDLDSDPFGSPAVGTPKQPEPTTPAVQAGVTPARPVLPTNLDDDPFFTGALPAGGKPATTTAPALTESAPANDFPADSGSTSMAVSDVPAGQPSQPAAIEQDPFAFGSPASSEAAPTKPAAPKAAFDPFADPVPTSGSPAQSSSAPAMTAAADEFTAADEKSAGLDRPRESTEDPFGGSAGGLSKPAGPGNSPAMSLESENAAATLRTVESENDPFVDVQPARPAMSTPPKSLPAMSTPETTAPEMSTLAGPARTASTQTAEFDPFGDPVPKTSRPVPAQTTVDVTNTPAGKPADVEADPFAPPIESPVMSAAPAMGASPGVAAQPEPTFDRAPRATPLPTSIDDAAEFARTPGPAQPAPAAEADPFGDSVGSAAPTTPAAPAMTRSAQPPASRSSSIPQDLTPEELGGFRPVPVEELETSRPAITGRDPVAVAVDPFATETMPATGARMLTPVPAATGIGGERYTVQPTDSFWTISKRVYGTGRYFQALAKHNAAMVSNPQHLKPGSEVVTPSAGDLERLYRADIPLADAASVKSLRSDHPDRYQPDQEPGFFLDAQGQPMYRVGSNDTLSQISQNHLGRSSRWIQIFQMNRDILKDGNTLSVGTVLKLPPDASQVQTIGYEVPGR